MSGPTFYYCQKLSSFLFVALHSGLLQRADEELLPAGEPLAAIVQLDCEHVGGSSVGVEYGERVSDLSGARRAVITRVAEQGEIIARDLTLVA